MVRQHLDLRNDTELAPLGGAGASAKKQEAIAHLGRRETTLNPHDSGFVCIEPPAEIAKILKNEAK